MSTSLRCAAPLMVALGCVGWAGCDSGRTGRAATAVVDSSVPPVLIGERSLYVSGEYLGFRLTWRGIKGGVTQVVSGVPGVVDGRRSLIVKSESRGAGIVAVFSDVRDELTSIIDLDHGAPTRAEAMFQNGRAVERVTVDIDGVDYRGTFEPADAPTRTWRQTVEGTTRVHNLHSALAVLRAWAPPPGTRGYLFAQTGRSLYRIDVTASGTTTFDSEAVGRVHVRRIDGTVRRITQDGQANPSSKPRTFSVWVSDDGRALPVRFEAQTSRGAVAATLFEARQDLAGRVELHAAPARE